MASKRNILRIVESLCQKMPKSELHLTSLAKAVEITYPKVSNIIIKPIDMRQSGPAILLTQELEATGFDGRQLNIREYFIFTSAGLEATDLNFAVTYEIGHIVLHTQDRSEDSRIYAPIPNSERLYAVKYTEREELEADIFAKAVLDIYSETQVRSSVFLSYAEADEKFATRLYDDLQANGVRCWKFDRDAQTGQTNWGEIEKAIRGNDKVLLIASKSSLQRPGVIREIERALRLEDERMRARATGEYTGDVNVLFPVRLDDYIFRGWRHERKVDVTRKVVANAQGWARNKKIYAKVLKRLLRDLTEDRPPADPIKRK